MTKTVVALGLLVSLAVPAPVLAQSAGDDQYVDPFQEEGGGGGGNNGGDNSNSQGGGGGDTGTTTTPAPVEPAVEETTAPVPAAGGNGTALPRTGLPLVGLGATGLLLLVGGAVLRRRV